MTVHVGDAAPPRELGPITRTDIVRYAGASGDFHPLHHDQGYAEASGFPTVFSMGMYQAGLLATYAVDWLGAEQIRRFTVRFNEQVWPGDVLTCSGTVVAATPRDGGQRVEVELTCARQTGGVAVSATAAFQLS